MNAVYLVEADSDDYDQPLRQVAIYASLASAQASVAGAGWEGPDEDEEGRRYWSNCNLDQPRCFITEFEVQP